jgi:hypothetical protein
MSTVAIGTKKTLYQKTYGLFQVDVYMLTKWKTIVYEMQGYIMPDMADAFVDDLVACARAHKPVAMIADPRDMRVLNKDFQKTVQTRFWPEIARLGVKKNPAIIPPDALTRGSVDRMVRTAGETITTVDGHKLEIALLASLEECLAFIG